MIANNNTISADVNTKIRKILILFSESNKADFQNNNERALIANSHRKCLPVTHM